MCARVCLFYCVLIQMLFFLFYVSFRVLVYFYYWYILEDEGMERQTLTASCKFTAADIVRNRLLMKLWWLR